MKNDSEGIRRKYEKSDSIKYIILFVSIVTVFALGFLFMALGVADTSVSLVLKAVWAWITGEIEGSPYAASYKIIVYMRLPGIIMAVFAGIGLSVSGAAMQSVTNNPLVSPFTIGISSAAAFGASLCIVFGGGIFFGSEAGIIFCAFVSSSICALLVYGVSVKAGMGAETIALAGIALNYFFNAMTSTVEFFAQEHKLSAVVQWTFGTFNGVTWDETTVVILFVSICTAVVYKYYLALNVMASGDDEFSKSLGVSPKFVRALMGALSVAMTSAIISFCGVIGFVGLVSPHIARMTVGNNHKFLIPFSAVIGAFLLLVSDIVGKTILSPVSIPVGIVISFLGVPLFINLILKGRKGRGI